MNFRALSLILLFIPLLYSCMGMPANVQPVTGFDLERYLGTWYEIARLDHNFERGLDNITANYSMREDGGLRVLNRGWSEADQDWDDAEGRAYFVEEPDTGYLKVSFFGPFYGSYVIFELDKTNYDYAFISGPDTSYLWLLSRTPDLDPALLERFREEADKRGFDTTALIVIDHELNPGYPAVRK